MQKSDYQNPKNWYGSSYELAIRIEHTEGKERLGNATRTLWKQPQISGIWQETRDYPDSALEIPNAGLGYGLLSLAEGQTVGCHVVSISASQGDWLDLGIPMGMLELNFDVEYSLASSINPWLSVVDEVFVAIAQDIYREVSFPLALVGEEVSGFTDQHSFRKEYLKAGGYLLSPEFHARMEIEDEGVVLPSGLRWFPPAFG